MAIYEPLQQSDCGKMEFGQLILFQEDSLASRLVKPGSAEAQAMTATSGRKCLELYGKSGHLGLLVKMLLESQAWQSQTEMLSWDIKPLPVMRRVTYLKKYIYNKKYCSSEVSLKILKKKDIMSNRFLFRLVVSEPRTKDTGCLSWPTPRANKVGGEASAGFSPTLEQVVKGWPTPKSTVNGPDYARASRVGTGDDLATAVAKLWTTPAAQDCKGSHGGGQHSSLRTDIYAYKEKTGEAGQLNADWVECLMNFPIGWTDINCDNPAPWPGPPALLGIGQNRATPNRMDMLPQRSPEALKRQFETTRKGRTNPANLREQIHPENFPNGITQTGQYPYEPPRVTTGQKNRAKRLKCLGNAVYPEQIYPIFAAIREIEAGA